MNFYRVKQTSKNTFIPQVKIGIFGTWDGLDENCCAIWFSNRSQADWCSVSTLEKANERIQDHKTMVKEKKCYPKYHYKKL